MKIFIINPIYAKYPRIKKRYDRTSKLWAALPTDAQYNKDFVEGEMNKVMITTKPFPKQALVFMSLQYKSFENTGKRRNCS